MITAASFLAAVHSGDVNRATGAVRHMQPQYANRRSAIIDYLVQKLNFVVYPLEVVAAGA